MTTATAQDTSPDWLLTSIRDRGPGEYYRYRVELINTARGDGGFWCAWDVRDLNDPRYGVHHTADARVSAQLAAARAVAP